MNRKIRPLFTATVSLLLLSTFVMVHNYIAHDYLHGRGNAVMSLAQLALLIVLSLIIYACYNAVGGGKSIHNRLRNILGEDKAPPQKSDVRKSREKLRTELKLRRKRHKEGRREAIKEYVDIMMIPFLDDNVSLDLLYQNIRHWHFSQEDGLAPEPIKHNQRLTSWDIRHFAWNIGERLEWSGIKRARFVKLCFPAAMKDLEVETIRRTLKQSPAGSCNIGIDVPDGKGDYRFHYPEDE